MPCGARSKTFPGDGAARRGVRPPRSEVVYNNQKARFAPELRRTRLSLSATSDYWVNAMAGDPVFVVTAPANAGLVKMLPGVLAQIRSLVGQRRLTGVFDRCGFSPKLFQQSLAAGFDLLTYRKGRHPKIPQKRFGKYRTSLGGRISTYTLADQEVRLLKGTLRLRQVTRRMDNGPQTPILTARRDLAAAQVAYRMFDRWRQENFFKYLREEYALDALVEYATTPDDATREVPNPAWAAADTKVRQADAQWERLQAEYGLEAWSHLEQQRRTMRGFKTAHGKLGQKIWAAWDQGQRLEKPIKVLIGTSDPKWQGMCVYVLRAMMGGAVEILAENNLTGFTEKACTGDFDLALLTPKLLLLDPNASPGPDPWEAAVRSVRKVKDHGGTAVVLAGTAEDVVKHEHSCREAGADAVVEKSFHAVAMMDTVRQVLALA